MGYDKVKPQCLSCEKGEQNEKDRPVIRPCSQKRKFMMKGGKDSDAKDSKEGRQYSIIAFEKDTAEDGYNRRYEE